MGNTPAPIAASAVCSSDQSISGASSSQAGAAGGGADGVGAAAGVGAGSAGALVAKRQLGVSPMRPKPHAGPQAGWGGPLKTSLGPPRAHRPLCELGLGLGLGIGLG